MWEEIGLKILVFEKSKVMDYIISNSSEEMKISAQLGLQFGERCKVIMHYSFKL